MLVDVKTLAVTVHVVLAIAVAVSVVVTVFVIVFDRDSQAKRNALPKIKILAKPNAAHRHQPTNTQLG